MGRFTAPQSFVTSSSRLILALWRPSLRPVDGCAQQSARLSDLDHHVLAV